MPEVPRIQIKPFHELSLKQLHACLMLRAEVFVVDQRICVEADPDALDPQCHHVLAWRGDELVGTARLLPLQEDKGIKVGRVAVGRDDQRQGIGSQMMRHIQSWIASQQGTSGVMSAQAHLERWYAGLGWVREGDRYTEAQIDHVRMVYRPQPADRHA